MAQTRKLEMFPAYAMVTFYRWDGMEEKTEKEFWQREARERGPDQAM